MKKLILLVMLISGVAKAQTFDFSCAPPPLEDGWYSLNRGEGPYRYAENGIITIHLTNWAIHPLPGWIYEERPVHVLGQECWDAQNELAWNVEFQRYYFRWRSWGGNPQQSDVICSVRDEGWSDIDETLTPDQWSFLYDHVTLVPVEDISEILLTAERNYYPTHGKIIEEFAHDELYFFKIKVPLTERELYISFDLWGPWGPHYQYDVGAFFKWVSYTTYMTDPRI